MTNVKDTNRDINNTQEITRDQTTGMLDGSVTIDHRLLTEAGRQEIIQEQKDLPENFRQSAENLAQALPAGEYKDKALQTLNNIQARLYNLPSEYKETGVVGDKVASELLKRGIEPKEVEALFSKLDFFYAAKEFSEIQSQLDTLAQSGVDLETIFKQPKIGVNEQEVIYAKGTDIETKVTTQTTVGMTILSNIADLGNNIKQISEDTGVDLGTVQLAVGLMISGPVRLAIETGKSLALDSAVGAEIAQGFDALATSLTAAAHVTNSNTINNWTNSEKVKEIEASTSENKLDELKFANEIEKNKQGAEYLINAVAGVVGAGVGKGVTKGKDADIEINQKQSLDVGWVDNYGNQKKVTGDGTVARDHQPSKAALLKRAEDLKEAPLTQAEKNRIINEGMSVTVPNEVHAAGPTYAGKNNKGLIENDANDLQAAQIRDSEAMIDNAKKLTPEYVTKLQEACTTLSCKNNADYDKFLKNIMDEEARKNDK